MQLLFLSSPALHLFIYSLVSETSVTSNSPPPQTLDRDFYLPVHFSTCYFSACSFAHDVVFHCCLNVYFSRISSYLHMNTLDLPFCKQWILQKPTFGVFYWPTERLYWPFNWPILLARVYEMQLLYQPTKNSHCLKRRHVYFLGHMVNRVLAPELPS